MSDYQVIIVGGGVAGLSCAIYTGQAGLRTLVIDKGESQLLKVKQIRNYPGLSPETSGEEWMHTARAQAESAGVDFLSTQVERLVLDRRPYEVTDQSGKVYTSDFIVLSVNLGFDLLENHGINLGINRHVPSKKIRYVEHANVEGVTGIAGVYVAGLLAHVPSQTVIAAGQGTFVGVQIASEALGRPYMWHD